MSNVLNAPIRVSFPSVPFSRPRARSGRTLPPDFTCVCECFGSGRPGIKARQETKTGDSLRVARSTPTGRWTKRRNHFSCEYLREYDVRRYHNGTTNASRSRSLACDQLLAIPTRCRSQTHPHSHPRVGAEARPCTKYGRRSRQEQGHVGVRVPSQPRPHGQLASRYWVENHASYLQHWLQGMTENPKYLLTAAAQAAKATDFVLSFSRESVEEPEAAVA